MVQVSHGLISYSLRREYKSSVWPNCDRAAKTWRKEGGKGSLRDSVVESCNKICTLEKGEMRKESICLLTKLTCSLVTLGLSPRRVLTGPSVRLCGGTSTGGKK